MLQILQEAGIAALFIAIPFYLALSYWCFKDARHRSYKVSFQFFSVILTLLIPFFGVFIYLLIRPTFFLEDQENANLLRKAFSEDEPEKVLRDCPSCSRPIEVDFVLCPHCLTFFARRCKRCQHTVRLGWALCPYCGEPQGLQKSDLKVVD
jgi:RNA polymerase subunit RPABC4/transcription elongation factor Spt4